jgi:hypothetical protein
MDLMITIAILMPLIAFAGHYRGPGVDYHGPATRCSAAHFTSVDFRIRICKGPI